MIAETPSSALGQRVAAYVETHLYERISAADIAASLCLNAGYLNTAFRQESGVTLTQYLHRRKIEEAQRLLRESGESITGIGAALGYFDQSHFCRRFKAETGVTPKQFRQKYPAKIDKNAEN